MQRIVGVLIWLGLLACGGAPASPNPPAAVPAGVPTAPPGWVTVHYWLGTGPKDTETFTTRRGEWRLAWRHTRGRAAIAVQVVDATTQAVVATTGNLATSDGDTTIVRAPAGRYFVRVQTVGAEWAVAVEEPR